MKTVWGPDAEEFKPERWIDQVTERITPVSPFKFSAFYGGPHACLGMKFANVRDQDHARCPAEPLQLEDVERSLRLHVPHGTLAED